MSRLCLITLIICSIARSASIDTAYFPRDSGPPYWYPGVPGGIPSTFTNIFDVTSYGAVGDGVTDNSTAFANAKASATSGNGVVYIPAGNFAFSTGLTFTDAKQYVVRGAGRNNTKLIYTGSGYPFTFGQDFTRIATSVSSGYSRGSTTLTLGSTSGMSTNNLILLWQTDDTNVTGNVVSQSAYIGSQVGTNHQGQLMKIIGINGNVVTNDMPVYYANFASGQNPQALVMTHPAWNVGCEDFTITNTGTADHIFYIGVAHSFWIKNVVSQRSGHTHAFCFTAHSGSIIDSDFLWHSGYDTTERHSVYLASWCSDNLVQNCIGDANNYSFVTYGSVGNVIAYSHSLRGIPQADVWAGGLLTHGNFSYFNLFEGNVEPFSYHDQTWGANYRNTDFRNWYTEKLLQGSNWGTYDTTPPYGIALDNVDQYHALIANIISSPEFAGSGVAYQIDSAVTNTLLMHYNYDWNTGSLQYSNQLSTNLPASYYLNSRPTAWLCDDMTWPPIGPDVSSCLNSGITNLYLIPAQKRFLTDLICIGGGIPSPAKGRWPHKRYGGGGI